MDFDKDEDSMDMRFNRAKNNLKKIKWNVEEIKLNNKIIEASKKKIAEIETLLFFALIDRYLFHACYEEFDIELDQEFQELNS